MKKNILIILVLSSIMSCHSGHFELLKDGNKIPRIVLLSENEAIKHATDNFISDLQKISGKENQQLLTNKIFIGEIGDIDVDEEKKFNKFAKIKYQLEGKWEAYRVFTDNNNLFIIGSDQRGTIWGIYHFIEDYLGIDPMYLWTDKKPTQTDELVLKNISISANEPTFKFRGWFVNDEDYLTEWKYFEGRRNNDYKYYFKIMHPDVSDMIIETALRLRMNMIVPSSFNDVLNPPEEYAIKKASNRGLIVTQHHIEPLGVGGFNFDDYFKKKGEKVPLFSYLENPDQMKEVWEHYVKAWSQYPDVIWQLGLRGRGDRQMWYHDPTIPDNDSIRGKIISDAICYQYDLVRKYDSEGEMTLTLWWEMADLMAAGHIDIPDDITLIFADNSPGWGFSSDFYDIQRDSDKKYGVYYHHQLWGSGPHFIQGVPPHKTYDVMKAAIDYESSNYCLLNVGNVKEFVLGLNLSSKLLYNFADYNVDDQYNEWFNYYYKEWADEVKEIYQDFFNHYLLDRDNKFKHRYATGRDDPYLLDGYLAEMMKSMLANLNYSYQLPEFNSELWITAAELVTPEAVVWNKKNSELLDKVKQQKRNLTPIIDYADKVIEQMDVYSAYFFNVNLRIPSKMFYDLMNCTIETMLATKEEFNGNRSKSVEHLNNALSSMEHANTIKHLITVDKWEHWYRGEYKIMFSSYEDYLNYLIENS